MVGFHARASPPYFKKYRGQESDADENGDALRLRGPCPGYVFFELLDSAIEYAWAVPYLSKSSADGLYYLLLTTCHAERLHRRRLSAETLGPGSSLQPKKVWMVCPVRDILSASAAFIQAAMNVVPYEKTPHCKQKHRPSVRSFEAHLLLCNAVHNVTKLGRTSYDSTP